MLGPRQSSSPQGERNSGKTPSEVERHFRDMLEGALTVSAHAQIKPSQYSKTPAVAVPQLEPGRNRALGCCSDCATNDRGNVSNYLPFITLPIHRYVNTK